MVVAGDICDSLTTAEQVQASRLPIVTALHSCQAPALGTCCLAKSRCVLHVRCAIITTLWWGAKFSKPSWRTPTCDACLATRQRLFLTGSPPHRAALSQAEPRQVLRSFTERFAHVFFTPGNHDLWVRRQERGQYDSVGEPTRASPDIN